MERFDARCILLNTGWSGGPYGVGKRISIKHTRALLDAALDGALDDVEFEVHPVFNLRMPKSCRPSYNSISRSRPPPMVAPGLLHPGRTSASGRTHRPMRSSSMHRQK